VSEPLPSFRFHPEPLATGSVEASDVTCLSCGLARGYAYVGPAYAVEELVGELCPWCVADGSAARQFDAQFTDVGWGVPPDLADEEIDELAHRTPGFSGWQQEHWLFHCGSGAAFLGRVGYHDLEAVPDALDMLLHEHDAYGWTAEEATTYVRNLDANGDATAYLFRCLACGTQLAYSDQA
jgi:uncharacterized protein